MLSIQSAEQTFIDKSPLSSSSPSLVPTLVLGSTEPTTHLALCIAWGDSYGRGVQGAKLVTEGEGQVILLSWWQTVAIHKLGSAQVFVGLTQPLYYAFGAQGSWMGCGWQIHVGYRAT